MDRNSFWIFVLGRKYVSEDNVEAPDISTPPEDHIEHPIEVPEAPIVEDPSSHLEVYPLDAKVDHGEKTLIVLENP